MSKNLTKAAFVDLLKGARQKIKDQFDYLNRLDSETGDGDHGTAAVASRRSAAPVLDARNGAQLGARLPGAALGRDCVGFRACRAAFSAPGPTRATRWQRDDAARILGQFGA